MLALPALCLGSWMVPVSAFPPENQLRVLAEHGIYDSFMAHWVSVEDVYEVARRLDADPEKAVRCDFHAARSSETRTRTGSRRRAWIARLAAGWSLIVYLDGLMPDSDPLSLGGQRVFDVACITGLDEIDELFYTHDGVSTGTLYDEEEYRVHWADLTYDVSTTAGQLEEYLTVLGRVSGRFLDRDFFSSQGLMIDVK
ncbi:hypothetical protein FDA94_36995 [Herbidospora galbida]|uniref:Uncharacterized protein n=1 Tax=Herbidospora galbida TaxID=2575442 RepID=A0A4U3LSS0_9ACTN|nr:hypothetical protein [Herbidospora galbida]TKK78830.1 hypothetical protein FDA94_36995 [Herbidospora galbida]